MNAAISSSSHVSAGLKTTFDHSLSYPTPRFSDLDTASDKPDDFPDFVRKATVAEDAKREILIWKMETG